MHDPLQAIDRYFTEQIVGTPFSVTLGPSVGQHQQPSRGVLIDRLNMGVHAALLATRCAWAGEPDQVVVGQPVSLSGLRRWRRGLLIGAWLAWSVALVGLVWWWRTP